MIFKTKKKNTVTYQMRNIPKKTWNRFKIKCMTDEIPILQDCILGLINQYLKGNVKP